MPWTEEQKKAASERMKARHAGRKNLIEPQAANTTGNGNHQTVVINPQQEEPKKQRFMPYFGPDSLPRPNEGQAYGEPRYYLNGSELIQVRKKIIKDSKSNAFDYKVNKICYINVDSRAAKKAGLRTILKQCNIPGAA